MPEGKVKWFNIEKGFGLVAPDGDELPDLFLHWSQLPETSKNVRGKREVSAEQRVQFELVRDNKGPQAKNVVLLGTNSQSTSSTN
ncbi:cold-shock protein [Nocardia altamirensis]|uniref:cold-shock protein n=1 Tax=Nocardia altamirensis TaxID=472158 RepID=UPI000840135A|nr:cold shock domain-containing protein [Nocardia altamirensis]